MFSSYKPSTLAVYKCAIRFVYIEDDKYSNEIFLEVTVSYNVKSGAIVPKGIIFDGVLDILWIILYVYNFKNTKYERAC